MIRDATSLYDTKLIMKQSSTKSRASWTNHTHTYLKLRDSRNKFALEACDAMQFRVAFLCHFTCAVNVLDKLHRPRNCTLVHVASRRERIIIVNVTLIARVICEGPKTLNPPRSMFCVTVSIQVWVCSF